MLFCEFHISLFCVPLFCPSLPSGPSPTMPQPAVSPPPSPHHLFSTPFSTTFRKPVVTVGGYTQLPGGKENTTLLQAVAMGPVTALLDCSAPPFKVRNNLLTSLNAHI